jgi:hypothetical protein
MRTYPSSPGTSPAGRFCATEIRRIGRFLRCTSVSSVTLVGKKTTLHFGSARDADARNERSRVGR